MSCSESTSFRKGAIRGAGRRIQWNMLSWLVVVGTLHLLADAFVPQPAFSRSTTEVSMVMDFFRQRSKEGLDQLNNIADSAAKGKLGKGLMDAAAYTANSNRAFADGLAKSRNRFLQNLEALFTGVDPEELLEELQDILLQADIGASTTDDIIEEVKSLREDSTKLLSKDDLLSIMRGKLLEALDTQQSSSVAFSTDESTPTVLFVMGAVRCSGVFVCLGPCMHF